MMAERGVAVDHTTIWRWIQHYAPQVSVHGGGGICRERRAGATVGESGAGAPRCWAAIGSVG
jgi:hypothetical protein